MIKSYKLFLESKSEIESICRRYRIQNWTLNEDGSIDVDGDVDIDKEELTKLPLKFRNVSRHFWCSNNQLTSLEGCPKSVGGGFFCHYNNLTSLKGCPESVGSDFCCHRNQLTTLEGGLKSVGGDFYCYNNQLTSLEGCPEYFKVIVITSNPIHEFTSLFKKLTPDIVRYLNEYDVIQDDIIVLDRLRAVVDTLGVGFNFGGLNHLKNYRVE